MLVKKGIYWSQLAFCIWIFHIHEANVCIFSFMFQAYIFWIFTFDFEFIIKCTSNSDFNIVNVTMYVNVSTLVIIRKK